MFTFLVFGTPVPQGSKSAAIRGGRAVMFDANSNLRAWRAAVTNAAREEMRRTSSNQYPKDVPLSVSLMFVMPKPKTAKREYATVKPDIDKLCRSILDSLTDSGIIAGDQQVTSLHAFKRYETDTSRPSVFVTISDVTE